MDQLQQYRSSGSDDDDDDEELAQHEPAKAQVVGADDSIVPASHSQKPQRHHHLRTAAEALERRNQEIAQRVAHPTTSGHGGIAHLLRHRMTREEQDFEFRGYTSKRRRRAIADQAGVKREVRSSVVLLPLFSTESAEESDRNGSAASFESLPTRVQHRYNEHTGAINAIQWNPNHADLFVSASMDSTVRVWNHREVAAPCRRVLEHHRKGVKSVKWSVDGRHVLSGGYDGCAAYTDAETAATLQRFHHHHADRNEDEKVRAVCFHPSDPNFFLVGSDKGRIYSRDLRQGDTVVATYQRAFGDVHDLLFLPGHEERFVSSAGVKYRDASHQTLLVWDFRSSVLLSERLDRDMQPFPCLRLHPRRPWFVAQCSANYAVLFSSKAPYKKLRKGKARFEGGHEVQGYSIQCSFNGDGSVLATGDASGQLVYYNTTSKNVVRKIEAYASPRTACICAEFHPAERSKLLAGGSNGQLLLFG